MRDSYRRLDLVHVLAAFAARAKGIDLQVARRNLDVLVNFLDFRNGIDAGKAGVPPLVRVKGRNANEAMDATLGLAIAISILSLDEQRGIFYSSAFAWQRVGHFDFPTARFGPALIHAHEHVGPIA